MANIKNPHWGVYTKEVSSKQTRHEISFVDTYINGLPAYKADGKFVINNASFGKRKDNNLVCHTYDNVVFEALEGTSISFIRCCFKEVIFIDCFIEDLDLNSCEFMGCQFINCTFRNSKITDCTFCSTVEKRNEYVSCHMPLATIYGTKFEQVDMINVDMEDSNLIECWFADCSIISCSFKGSFLRMVYILKTVFEKIDFSKSSMFEVEFDDFSKLVDINIESMFIQRTNFSYDRIGVSQPIYEKLVA